MKMKATLSLTLLIEKSEAAGFIHYEISNFGKPGYFSVHNSNYWKQVPLSWTGSFGTFI